MHSAVSRLVSSEQIHSMFDQCLQSWLTDTAERTMWWLGCDANSGTCKKTMS